MNNLFELLKILNSNNFQQQNNSQPQNPSFANYPNEEFVNQNINNNNTI